MEKEKIFKKHEGRKDLAGEHAFGDIGQIILLAIFLTVWITDSFFIKFSILTSDYFSIYIRISLAMIVLIIAIYLAKQGLTIVFAEVREKPIVIQKSVFSIVRHPIYLGAILFYPSLLILSFSLSATIVWAAVIIFYFCLCKHEEKLLLETYGQDYEKYKLETPMLIPRVIKRNIKCSLKPRKH
ncbi:MAG: isoprenylcysteine carboxylmethyltransferase family protein [Desulfobacterales bacterium]|nr:isoprenylcysteine carboxylmethyltransferase family protein [Desulfobacterales bacterium]